MRKRGGRGLVRLVFAAASSDNSGMELLGHIQNGVVVFDSGESLPEGTRVTVAPVRPTIVEKPGELPVVVGGEPGTMYLTNERINEILDQEDIEAMKLTWNVPS